MTNNLQMKGMKAKRAQSWGIRKAHLKHQKYKS